MKEAQRVRIFDRLEDGLCERCHERPASEMHHIAAAGLGGKRDRNAPDSAYEALCWQCHGTHGTVGHAHGGPKERAGALGDDE